MVIDFEDCHGRQKLALWIVMKIAVRAHGAALQDCAVLV